MAGSHQRGRGRSFQRPSYELLGEGADAIYLSAGELARLLGVSRSTVDRWARQGRIASIRTLGGHLRFNLRDLEPLLFRGAGQADGDGTGPEGLVGGGR